MTPTNITDQLKRDEGLRLSSYVDTTGNETIGYGHKVRPGETFDSPISQWVANQLLAQDIQIAAKDVQQKLPWSGTLSQPRLGVLVNMAFNMGINGVLEFHHMLMFVQIGDFKNAAIAMRASLWHKQVGARAERLAVQMEVDEWQ